MRKSIWIFLLAVLVPSAVLGWLALRSAEEQKIILERRTAQLCQAETESLAAGVRAIIEDQRRTFSGIVQKLVAGDDPAQAAGNFSSNLTEVWNRKAVGFVIARDGRLLAPTAADAERNLQCRQFLVENSAFLGNKVAVTVYPVPLEELATTRADVVRKLKGGYDQKQVSEIASSLAAQQRAAPQKAPAEAAPPPPPPPAPAPSGRSEPSSQPLASKTEDRPAAMQKLVPAAPSPAAPPRSQGTSSPSVGKPQPATRSRSSEADATGRSADASKRDRAPSAPKPAAQTTQREIAPTDEPESVVPMPEDAPNKAVQQAADAPVQSEQQQQTRMRADYSLRNVMPQQVLQVDRQQAPVSQLTWATTDFEALTNDQTEGVITRFVEDRLNMIFWLRLPQAPEWIFGCLVDANDLRDLWSTALPDPQSDQASRLSSKPDFVLALLDDKARLVMSSAPHDVQLDWKRPFVASEIGEALPHWEATLYLRRPEVLQESARGAWLMLLLLIVASIGAIACGGWLVVSDARRQMALAQQKTDFVSNVSHELKTPLTSIRMFAELMHSGRMQEPTKLQQYLRIIMVEAERLTRLINNVLDFAKLERRQKRFEKKPLDLHRLVETTWEGHELHLRENGFATRWEAADPPYPVVGDEDALAQILVNLLSNAEKYSGDRKEIDLHTYTDDGNVCVSVLDRGPGVPAGEERKIFEAFYRAHDSLSSGIQGTGLGLTLARQLAREHGGEIVYSRRQGGGSNFTLKLPRADRKESSSINS